MYFNYAVEFGLFVSHCRFESMPKTRSPKPYIRYSIAHRTETVSEVLHFGRTLSTDGATF